MKSAPVDVFSYCPRCGQPIANSAGANPFHCPNCDLRLFFNSATAVAALIVRDDGSLLCVKRAHDPGRGLLGLPGGFVDFGETAETALRREVREEVGIDVTKLEYLSSFPNEYVYAGVTYQTLDLFFVAKAERLESARPLDGVTELVWEPLQQADLGRFAFTSLQHAVTACQHRMADGRRKR